MMTHPVGTGPWKFVSRKPREELIVERFEDYWNEDARPSVDRLVIKIIPEDTTRVAMYTTPSSNIESMVGRAFSSRSSARTSNAI